MGEINDHFMGRNGYVWFMGVIEDRKDPLNTGRARVRIFGWNTSSKVLQPTDELLWALPMYPLNSKSTYLPVDGTMVQGFFMDGEGGQYPVILNQVPGIPDTPPNPEYGFRDMREEEELAKDPRPPAKITYNHDGTGAQIEERPKANNYPYHYNEPTNVRIARNEKIDETLIQLKKNNTILNVPVASGAVEVGGGIDLEAFLSLKLSLNIPLPGFIQSAINLINGFEVCGVGINSLLGHGLNLNGITLQAPTVLINGSFLMGGEIADALLAAATALKGLSALASDLNGCLNIGSILNGFLSLDGSLIPLLPNLSGNIKLGPLSLKYGVGGTVTGGVPLGTMGGIPISSGGAWSEPETPYATKYPYSHVNHTESGHAIETDDTFGAERLHIYHRSGTFDEYHPDGSRVSKTVKNHYQITLSDHDQLVEGNAHHTVKHKETLLANTRAKTVNGEEMCLYEGDQTETLMSNRTVNILKDDNLTIAQGYNLNVKGSASIVTEKDFIALTKGAHSLMVIGDCIIAVNGRLTIGAAEGITINAGGNVTLNVEGDVNTVATGDFNVTARAINLNAATTAAMNAGGSAALNGGTAHVGGTTATIISAGEIISLEAPIIKP